MPSPRPNRALADAMRATGEAGSSETNLALYPRVAAGDPAAIDEMIQSNMALVVAKAKNFVESHPRAAHLHDDLISEGFVGLTKAVHSMARNGPQPDANPTGLIARWIDGHLNRLSDSPVTCSARTRFLKAKRGEQLPRSVDTKPAKGNRSRVPNTGNEPYFDPRGLRELRDELVACAKTDDDRQILRMREQGFSDREIGEAIGKSTTHVYNARRAIEARFYERQHVQS